MKENRIKKREKMETKRFVSYVSRNYFLRLTITIAIIDTRVKPPRIVPK